MQHYNQLSEKLEKSKTWECSLFFNESSHKQPPVVVDLCQKMESGIDYVFPIRFFGIQAKKELVQSIKLSGIQCGFHLDIRNSRSGNKCSKHLDYEMIISCLRGIPYREKVYKKPVENNNVTKKSNVTRTRKRKYERTKEKNTTFTWKYKDPEKKCPFSFTIQLITIDYKAYPFREMNGRWILKSANPNYKKNCRLHCHHFHMLTEHLNAPNECMHPAEKLLAKQCRECGISSASISHLLNNRNESGYNIDWNPAQIFRLTQKEDYMKGLSPNATTAENLVKSFNQRDDVDFLYVTFHPSGNYYIYNLSMLFNKKMT